jgi:hypothetical protein
LKKRRRDNEYFKVEIKSREDGEKSRDNWRFSDDWMPIKVMISCSKVA